MSLDYALAKELKDAGFPLKQVPDVVMGGPFNKIDNKFFYDPTLSELIEAGGDMFGLVQRKSNWIAMSADAIFYRAGSTPEEAVARLWLALHQSSA
jgi:hypothetical protein